MVDLPLLPGQCEPCVRRPRAPLQSAAVVSPARNNDADYKAWGYSSVANPYGEIIAKAECGEEIVYADIDLDKMRETRANLPYLSQKRKDLYDVVQY